jgi:hypothetical protein
VRVTWVEARGETTFAVFPSAMRRPDPGGVPRFDPSRIHPFFAPARSMDGAGRETLPRWSRDSSQQGRGLAAFRTS